MSRSAVVYGAIMLSVAALALVIVTAKDSTPDPAFAEAAAAGIYFHGVPLGKVRSLGWPPQEELERAAIAFSTVGSCLSHDPAKAASLTIAWGRIASDAEAEVCLSRVASRLGSPEALAAWLESHDFIHVQQRPLSPHEISFEASEKAGTVVQANWSLTDNGAMFRRGIVAPLLQKMFGHGVSISITISEPSRHVSTNVTTTIL
jgi:hypothetical protein